MYGTSPARMNLRFFAWFCFAMFSVIFASNTLQKSNVVDNSAQAWDSPQTRFPRVFLAN